MSSFNVESLERVYVCFYYNTVTNTFKIVIHPSND